MKPALLLLALAAAPPAEDVHTLSLVFEAMHCDACRESLEANLKVLRGVVGVAIDGTTARVSVKEGTPLDGPRLKRAVPTDLKLTAILLEARGVVAAGEPLRFTPKSAVAALELANRKETPAPDEDRIAQLRQALAGGTRFSLRGELVEKDRAWRLLLDSFERAEWKE